MKARSSRLIACLISQRHLSAKVSNKDKAADMNISGLFCLFTRQLTGKREKHLAPQGVISYYYAALYINACGEVAEWLKAHAWKVCLG